MKGPKRWFANTRMRNKILTGFGAVVLLLVTVAVLVLIQTERVQDLGVESRRATNALLLSDQLEVALSERVASFRAYMLSASQESMTDHENADLRFEETLATLLDSISTPEQIRQLQTVQSAANAWEETVAIPGFELRQRSLQPGGPPMDSIIAFFQDVGETRADAAIAEIDEFRTDQQEVADAASLAREQAIGQIRNVTLLATLAGAILSVLLAAWLAGIIAARLRRAVDFAAAVAAGDFTQQIPPAGDDELGELVTTLNEMSADLRGTVGSVGSATTQVATAADEIAAASEQISRIADQQVQATEDTSSSMEEIASQIARVARSAESFATSVDQTSTSITQMSNSIEQTATSTESLGASVEQTSTTIEEMAVSMVQVGRHVEETREIATTAEEDARSGGAAVERTTHGMRRIHAEMEALTKTIEKLGSTSESIGRISEVIENIADQTNLLALNASIEAARAGDQGRGFSVVAQEIRRLAERSVEETREIGATVRDVVGDMERVIRSGHDVASRTHEGIELAESAGGALEKIISSSGRTRELMEEVALATRQQIDAAEQAQDAVRHIQDVTAEVRIATREQATGSRQIAEAVENMSEQTQEVFAATNEQKKGGEMVLSATEEIKDGARTTQEAIREMAQAARDLSDHATRLSELASQFRV
ncbi:MAG: methyl-accepting chemotaxis protein [Gemmatimonadota bacterium]